MRTITTIGIILSLAACGVESSATGGDDGGADSSTSGPPGLDSGSGSDGEAAPPVQITPPGVTGAIGPYFDTTMFWNTDVSTVTKAGSSAAIIASLAAAGGWGNGNRFQIDFSIDLLTANASTPKQSFTPTDDFFSPDCDHVAMPIPPGGNIEGETGYACVHDGDCHLLVHDTSTNKLYEMWRANITSTFQGGCLAVWNLQQAYTQTLRGDQCTSADAAGYPITPLLFTADEVKAGHIDHAIRFVLPNDRVKRGFVRPATHATNTTGGSTAPSYGVHLRLRANYPIASLSPGAQVVARAMQKYGMYHADGGQIALTAQSDRHTTAKWSGLLGPHDLAVLKVTDFEVIDHGTPIALTGDSNR